MPELQAILPPFLGIAAAACALAAVLARNLLRAVAAFALSSAFLAALFFTLGAPFAGAVELTVGAGLVSVLLLVSIVLSGGGEEAAHRRAGGVGMQPRKALPAIVVATAFAALFAVVLVAAVRSSGKVGIPPLPAGPASPGAVLWERRTLEVLAQGAVLLAGVMGVLSVLRPRHGREEGA